MASSPPLQNAQPLAPAVEEEAADREVEAAGVSEDTPESEEAALTEAEVVHEPEVEAGSASVDVPLSKGATSLRQQPPASMGWNTAREEHYIEESCPHRHHHHFRHHFHQNHPQNCPVPEQQQQLQQQQPQQQQRQQPGEDPETALTEAEAVHEPEVEVGSASNIVPQSKGATALRQQPPAPMGWNTTRGEQHTVDSCPHRHHRHYPRNFHHNHPHNRPVPEQHQQQQQQQQQQPEEDPEGWSLKSVLFRLCLVPFIFGSEKRNKTTLTVARTRRDIGTFHAPIWLSLVEKMGSVPSSVIAQQISLSESTGVLVLTNRGLADVPPKVFSLCNVLRLMDLSANHLTSLPAPAIGQFSSLKSLFLNQNRITNLPREVGQLEKLECLSLSYNFLDSLPESVSRMPNLREVKLAANRFKQFPRVLADLPQLELLDLSLNSISSLSSATYLSSLQAIDLNLNENFICNLPDELAGAPRLRILRLQTNQLTLNDIPVSLLRDSMVSHLLLEGNKFEVDSLKNLEGYNRYVERFVSARKNSE